MSDTETTHANEPEDAQPVKTKTRRTRRWELPEEGTTSDARVQAWHATYNAAITGQLSRCDFGSEGFRVAHRAAARIANLTHGKIDKVLVLERWVPGEHGTYVRNEQRLHARLGYKLPGAVRGKPVGQKAA